MSREFTVWCIHECNAAFLKNFISDKHRLVLWLSAFFLIFWNRGETPAAGTATYYALASSFGAFLLFALQSLAANKLFGREAELLAGWFLLACPGFLVYARFGMLQPLCAGMVFALVLYMAYAPSFGAVRAFFFGFFCGVIALCSSLCAGILLPLTCVGFLRKSGSGKMPGVLRILCFLAGASVTAVPLFWCPGMEDGVLPFRDWWTIFALGFRTRAPEMDFALIALALSPLFLTVVPAMDAVHRHLTADRQGKGRLTNLLLAVFAGCAGGAAAFGVPVVLPCLAVCAAWLYTQGKEYAAQWRLPWDQWALNTWRTVLPLLILCGFCGLFLPQVLADAGVAVTEQDLTLLYFRMPGAALAAAVVLLVRRKASPWYALLPAICAALLVLMP